MHRIFAAAMLLLAVTACHERPRSAGATVKVITEGGHGSGVHIGSGLILTAAHVAELSQKPKIKTDTGQEMDAEVLWMNAAYDVALLRFKEKAVIAVAKLSCRLPIVGEVILASGNPGPLEFVTTRGHVAGPMTTAGAWTEVSVTDITVVSGMSGGPIFDADGYVIGITVAVLNAAPITLIVPGSTICLLMGRVT